MTRQAHFQAMFDLPLGETILMDPKPGETVEAALARLKLRGTKWRAKGRAYRMKIVDHQIAIQRLELGRHLKHADWWLLKGGERLLLKEKPSQADVKKAKATADYLNITRREREWEKAGRPLQGLRDLYSWDVQIDIKGRLVATRTIDEAIANGAPLVIDPDPKALWDGEWR